MKHPIKTSSTKHDKEMNPFKYEESPEQGVEIVVAWKGLVMQVHHFKNNPKRVKNFYIGEDPSSDFFIPVQNLEGQTKFPLILNSAQKEAMVNLIPGARADIAYGDGSKKILYRSSSKSAEEKYFEKDKSFCIALEPSVKIRIDFNDLTFFIKSVPVSKAFCAPFALDWASKPYFFISGAIHVLCLILIYFIPPYPRGFSMDSAAIDNRFAKYMITSAQVTQQESTQIQETAEQQQGGKGKRHSDSEGQMGKVSSPKTDNSYKIKGPKDNTSPQMARENLKQMARSSGILNFLSKANAPTSTFGADSALGMDPESTLGALMGKQGGINFGYGGLGLTGTGRGGGGVVSGTIGVGKLGTIGHGGGGGKDWGYGRDYADLSKRRGAAIEIKPGAATVQGSLSKDIIRRIIGRHINEVKFCYEKQLSARPDLAGRVVVRFVITASGAVGMAVIENSTVSNTEVENCIAIAVKRWTFPEPQGGGVVIVSYPFLLQSAN